MSQTTFAGIAMQAGRSQMLARIETLGGQAGRQAADRMSDAEIASVLWSLRLCMCATRAWTPLE